jgi:hypothetical protein
MVPISVTSNSSETLVLLLNNETYMDSDECQRVKVLNGENGADFQNNIVNVNVGAIAQWVKGLHCYILIQR